MSVNLHSLSVKQLLLKNVTFLHRMHIYYFPQNEFWLNIF